MIGLNCALGAEELRPYVEELSRVADTHVSVHPNAGLPNAFGEYDETPPTWPTSSASSPPAASSTSSAAAAAPRPSISRHRAAVADCRRAPCRGSNRSCRLSGARALNIGPAQAVRQRRRTHQRHRLGEVPPADRRGRLRGRAGSGAQQVESGAQVIDVNMDEGMLDSVAAMDRFLKLYRRRARHRRVPVMIDSSRGR
jgi:5-methyltetrahydrofolate--homocysteine methyltransferase